VRPRRRTSAEHGIVLPLMCAASGMKTKLTFGIDADLLRQARVVAAEGRPVCRCACRHCWRTLVRGRGTASTSKPTSARDSPHER
jgi:hypothetical protein